MRIGWIGLGNMGGRMGKHTPASHEVLVHDLDPVAVERLVGLGATDATSIAGVCDGVDGVFLSLPGPPQVEAVVDGPDGLLAHLDPGTAIIDLSTSKPQLSQRLAEKAAERDIGFIDAPVTGGVQLANKGQVFVLAGGDKDVIDRFNPVFDTFASRVVHCGDVGTGDVVKIVNNMLAFVNLMGAIEGLVLGVKAGVDPAVLRDTIAGRTGNSFYWPIATKVILDGRIGKGFTTELAAKDLRLAMDLAGEVGVPTAMGAAVTDLMEGYRDNGMADEDVFATVRAIEEAADFVVRGLAPDLE